MLCARSKAAATAATRKATLHKKNDHPTLNIVTKAKKRGFRRLARVQPSIFNFPLVCY
jgi:hypothetical protein